MFPLSRDCLGPCRSLFILPTVISGSRCAQVVLFSLFFFFFLSSVQMWSRTEVMCLIQCVLLTRESLRAVLMYSAGAPVWIQVLAAIGCLGNGAQRRKCELWPAVAESYPAGGRSAEREAGRRLRVARPTWPLQAALWSITRSASHRTSVFLPPTGATNPSKPSSFPFFLFVLIVDRCPQREALPFDGTCKQPAVSHQSTFACRDPLLILWDWWLVSLFKRNDLRMFGVRHDTGVKTGLASDIWYTLLSGFIVFYAFILSAPGIWCVFFFNKLILEAKMCPTLKTSSHQNCLACHRCKVPPQGLHEYCRNTILLPWASPRCFFLLKRQGWFYWNVSAIAKSSWHQRDSIIRWGTLLFPLFLPQNNCRQVFLVYVGTKQTLWP